MSAPPDNQFGIDWTETARRMGVRGISLFERHTLCAYHNIGLGSFYHRKERIKAIWPQFAWHRWADRRLEGMCRSRWVTWLGCASSGKSTDAAVFALEYWLQAPHETAVMVCSTSVHLLRMRIWAEIVKYHSALPKNLGPVGELVDSKTLVRWTNGNDRNGIFGMAVEEGPTEQIVNNLIGIKAKRVLLILDEMQGVREAILRATNNLVSNPIFAFVGMGNPDSFLNPLGRESEPVKGWDSVIAGETEEWETHGGPVPGPGLCQFFDGRKSPADDSPEDRQRLSWLLNKDKREGILKGCRGNINDPSYWQMGIGWPPPMGLTSTVLDAATINKFKCREKPVWTDGYFNWASLDPSFEGGDRKVLTVGRCGEVRDETGLRWVIAIREQVDVPVNAKSDEPIHHQIVHWVMAYLRDRKMGPSDFALDSSGEGGGLKAIFDQEWGTVIGIEFGGRPSDTPVPGKPGKTAKDEYNTRASELNLNVREFALSNGLRGLPPDAEKDFVQRTTFYKNNKWAVEPKTGSKSQSSVKGFKQRLGRSPDCGDSVAIGVALCIQRGAFPATAVPADDVGFTEMQMALAARDEFSDENYLESYDFSDT